MIKVGASLCQSGPGNPKLLSAIKISLFNDWRGFRGCWGRAEWKRGSGGGVGRVGVGWWGGGVLQWLQGALTWPLRWFWSKPWAQSNGCFLFGRSSASAMEALPSFLVRYSIYLHQAPSRKIQLLWLPSYSFLIYRKFGHRKTVRNLPKFLVHQKEKVHLCLGSKGAERPRVTRHCIGKTWDRNAKSIQAIFFVVVGHFCVFQIPAKYELMVCVNLKPCTRYCYGLGWGRTYPRRQSSSGFVMTGLDFRMVNRPPPSLRFHSVFCPREDWGKWPSLVSSKSNPSVFE